MLSFNRIPLRLAALFVGILYMAAPELAFASVGTANYTTHWVGITSLIIFIVAYALVIGEEAIHLRKSKPVIIAAGLIWALVAYQFAQDGNTTGAGIAVRHNILEFAELFLFLLAAMTYINTMEERNVFSALRVWMIGKGFSFKQVFWLTGVLAFFISPIADNLTTALLMVAVVMAVGGDNKKFVVVSCINVVVAANAGGAFSPFGDITTLMVWQKGLIQFTEFFALFLPSVVNWLIPAVIMSMTLPKGNPDPVDEAVTMKQGALIVVGLFLFTISLAVMAHNFLHLPPALGMMTGLGILKVYGWYLKRFGDGQVVGDGHLNEMEIRDISDGVEGTTENKDQNASFDIFQHLARAEWDTLMFFYGIVLCVGGLGSLGFLAVGSEWMYGDLGATNANILVGFLSAVVDNIPVMFAVLTSLPEMDQFQWLLVTLTAGVGGSMLSIGSAAGVAVMGQARGIYTFGAHLKWSWAIMLGYFASIWVHFLVNG